MAQLSIPTTAPLPAYLRVSPANPIVLRILSRLSRPSLLSLALSWLNEETEISSPFLADEDEDEESGDMYPPAKSVEELRASYLAMQSRKGFKREVLDRIAEGDWRHGLSLYQLAMADLQHLYDHPASQKWTAYRIVSLEMPSEEDEAEEPLRLDTKSLTVPRFHPPTFLRKLQAQVLPDVKAHYNIERHKSLPILFLRIFIVDSPYNTDIDAASGRDRKGGLSSFDSAKTLLVAFPDASPHIYISKPQKNASVSAEAGEGKSLQNLLVKGISKALSQPRQRYTLEFTNLTTRNLAELLEKRGAGRTNSAGGGWGIYADEKKKESPLDTILPTPPLSEGDDDVSQNRPEGTHRKRAVSPATERERRDTKRAKLVARSRFGNSAQISDGKGVERVDITLEDTFPQSSRTHPIQRSKSNVPREQEREPHNESSERPKGQSGRVGRNGVEQSSAQEDDDSDEGTLEEATNAWRPKLRLTFHGHHVFAGIRQLVEYSIIDGERMPGWMTGEEGVTLGAVRHGRIRGHKGAGA